MSQIKVASYLNVLKLNVAFVASSGKAKWTNPTNLNRPNMRPGLCFRRRTEDWCRRSPSGCRPWRKCHRPGWASSRTGGCWSPEPQFRLGDPNLRLYRPCLKHSRKFLWPRCHKTTLSWRNVTAMPFQGKLTKSKWLSYFPWVRSFKRNCCP